MKLRYCWGDWFFSVGRPSEPGLRQRRTTWSTVSFNRIMKSILIIPATIKALALGQGFANALALMAGFDAKRVNAILLACEEAFAAIVTRAAKDGQPVRLEGELTPLALILTFIDQEVMPAPDEDAPLRLDVADLDKVELGGLGRVLIRAAADQALWQANGREGNSLRLTFNRPQPDIIEHAGSEPLEPFETSSGPAPPEQTTYQVRRAGEERDWFQISRAIYRAYGYTHPSDDIYYPDRVRELNRTGRLLSVVATTAAAEVVGHYALELGGLGQVAARQTTVAETGMAVVDPAHRGRKLMEQMRELLETEAQNLGLLGLFGQPVTSHPFSQQVNEKFGGHPCALSLAFLAGNLRFRAMGRDSAGQRESCLLYFKPLIPPRRRLIFPPPRHREILLDTYHECGIPVEADQAAAPDGTSQVSAHYLAALDLGMIRVEAVGRDIGRALRAARNDLCRQAGVRVLYLTMRLTRPGCAEACAAAEQLGFFYSGLAPHFDEGEDVLRLQSVDTTLDAGKLVVVSPFATRLLAYVEADRRSIEQC